MPNIDKKNKGFTLVELLVAMALFITIMTVSMGSIVSIFDANRKARNLKTTLANLNLSLESVSREIRFGTNYHCGNSGILTLPQDCDYGSGGNSYFTFLSSDGQQIRYRRNNSRVEKQIGTNPWVAVTGPEIIIQIFRFYTFGSATSDFFQPKVVIIVRGTVGTGSQKAITRFTVQTLVSQRVLDR